MGKKKNKQSLQEQHDNMWLEITRERAVLDQTSAYIELYLVAKQKYGHMTEFEKIDQVSKETIAKQAKEDWGDFAETSFEENAIVIFNKNNGKQARFSLVGNEFLKEIQ